MKKSLISFVATIIVLTIFSGLSTTASASLNMSTTMPSTSKSLIESSEQEQIQPTAIFVPDRCICPYLVTKAGSGWYVYLHGGAMYFLDKKAKHGFRNPKAGSEIEIQVNGSGSIVTGWRVTGK